MTNLKLLLTILFTISIFICSCGSKKKQEFSKSDKILLDSLNGKYKENYSFAFADATIVYTDGSQSTISDTLTLATLVFLDSVFYVAKDSLMVQMYSIEYVKKGKVMKGILHNKDVALKYFSSKKDSSLFFLANYVPLNDEVMVIIKSIRNDKLETELTLDTSSMNGFEMDMYLTDSIKLANTYEVFYINTYYPACGYTSTHYYINYRKNKFSVILSEVAMADAPYYYSPKIYLPITLDSKNPNLRLLYQAWGNTIVRDTLSKPFTYTVGSNINTPLNELIYIEYWHNKDSTIHGKTLMDQYGEPALFDVCMEKKLFRWTGKKLKNVSLK